MRKFFVLFLLLFIGISSIYAETVRMKVGDTKMLSPSVLSTKVLAGQPAWTSSRPNDVKIVSTTMFSCTIEAVKSFTGYATIHCLYYYRELDPVSGEYIYQRSGYVDYIVYVEEIEIKSVEISPTNIELVEGETYSMNVAILPSNANQKVTWSSSKSSVASVNSNNVLKANGYGTAVVTATANNGLSASCSVKVKKNESDSGNNVDNNNDNTQSNTNYDEVNYYYHVSKKRIDALRNKAIQQHNKKL